MNPTVDPKAKTGEADPTELQKQEPQPQPQDEPLGLPAIEFINRSLGIRKKKEATAAGEDDAPPPPKPKRAAAKAKPQPAPAPAPAVIDEDKLGEAVGRAVVQAQALAKEKADAIAKPQIPDDQKQRIAVLQHMAKKFPGKYEGLADRYLENQAKLDEYVEQWKKDHPDEEFNPEDDEHVEHTEQLEAQLDYDEDDYVDALTDIKLDEKLTAKLATVDEHIAKRLEPIEQKEQLQAHAQPIKTQRTIATENFYEKFGPEYGIALTEDGKLDPQSLDELKEADPDIATAIQQGAQAAEVYAAETYMLDHGLSKFDEKNPVHEKLIQFELAAEQKILKKPAQAQLDEEGRQFVPRETWNKMTEAQLAKHWTFNHEDLAYLISTEIAAQTKKFLKNEEEKFTRRAKTKGLLRTEPPPVDQSQHLLAKMRRYQETQDVKPDSPTTSLAPRLAPSKTKSKETPGGPLEGFVLRALGKA